MVLLVVIKPAHLHPEIVFLDDDVGGLPQNPYGQQSQHNGYDYITGHDLFAWKVHSCAFML